MNIPSVETVTQENLKQHVCKIEHGKVYFLLKNDKFYL